MHKTISHFEYKNIMLRGYIYAHFISRLSILFINYLFSLFVSVLKFRTSEKLEVFTSDLRIVRILFFSMKKLLNKNFKNFYNSNFKFTNLLCISSKKSEIYNHMNMLELKMLKYMRPFFILGYASLFACHLLLYRPGFFCLALFSGEKWYEFVNFSLQKVSQPRYKGVYLFKNS
jgi:hypothetical protein